MVQTRDCHMGRDRGCKGGDPEHPSQNGARCPVLRGHHVGVRYRGAEAHPRTVFQFILALLPHVSMFHLNNPYISVGVVRDTSEVRSADPSGQNASWLKLACIRGNSGSNPSWYTDYPDYEFSSFLL
jgi:hypothetical protein